MTLPINIIHRPPTPFPINQSDAPVIANPMPIADRIGGVDVLEVLVQLGRGDKNAALQQLGRIRTREITEHNYPWLEEVPDDIDSLFDKLFLLTACYQPQVLTEIGLLESVGVKRHNACLNDLYPAKREDLLNEKRDLLGILKLYSYELLTPEQKTTYKILFWNLRQEVEAEKFLYHEYLFTQLEGPMLKLVQLMTEYHKLETAEDVDNYLVRLDHVDEHLVGALATLELQQRLGNILPSFAAQKVIDMINEFTGVSAEENVLFQTLDAKLANIDLPNKAEIRNKAKTAIETVVYPSLGMIRTYFEDLLPNTHENGVWALPDGDAYYDHALKMHTTTDMTAEEIHELGLKEVASIHSQMRSLLALEGIADPEKSLGELIQEMNEKGNFYFPNTPDGKKQCIDAFENILKRCREQLWPLFDLKPKSAVTVKPVAPHEEAGAPGACYFPPSMDGTRPGVFYVNLRDTKENPTYGMETLAVHEAEPGHHFQLTLQNEMPIPLIRKMGSYTAYVEGWALYTEKLAYEEGFYSNNFSKIGHLQDELLRAVRLVVDTGIHRKRWTRQQAIDYMKKATGYTEDTVVTEVERYFVLPGQACAYKIGQIKILELRQRAKDRLGSKFNIQEFHNVVLKLAAAPLQILEEAVEQYINVNA